MNKYEILSHGSKPHIPLRHIEGGCKFRLDEYKGDQRCPICQTTNKQKDKDQDKQKEITSPFSIEIDSQYYEAMLKGSKTQLVISKKEGTLYQVNTLNYYSNAYSEDQEIQKWQKNQIQQIKKQNGNESHQLSHSIQELISQVLKYIYQQNNSELLKPVYSLLQKDNNSILAAIIKNQLTIAIVNYKLRIDLKIQLQRKAIKTTFEKAQGTFIQLLKNNQDLYLLNVSGQQGAQKCIIYKGDLRQDILSGTFIFQQIIELNGKEYNFAYPGCLVQNKKDKQVIFISGSQIINLNTGTLSFGFKQYIEEGFLYLSDMRIHQIYKGTLDYFDQKNQYQTSENQLDDGQCNMQLPVQNDYIHFRIEDLQYPVMAGQIPRHRQVEIRIDNLQPFMRVSKVLATSEEWNAVSCTIVGMNLGELTCPGFLGYIQKDSAIEIQVL